MSSPTQPTSAATRIGLACVAARLGLEVFIWRKGLLPPIALAAIVTAMALHWIHTVPARAAGERLRHELDTVRVAAVERERPPLLAARDEGQGSALLAIHLALGRAAHADAQMQQIVDIAERHGMALPRADYQTSVDAATKVSRVKVVLPIAGSYLRLRAFLEDVLRSLPSASVDHVAFKRESPTQTGLHATIGLSLWRMPIDEAARTVATTSQGGQP